MTGSRNHQRRRARGCRRDSPDGSRSGDSAARFAFPAHEGSRKGGAGGPGRGHRVPELCELSPLSAFCAVYLGITEEDGHRPAGLPAVAKRFDVAEDELLAYLEEHDLSHDCVHESDFDLESARLDIQVAPDGVSRLELARTLFEEYSAARRV